MPYFYAMENWQALLQPAIQALIAAHQNADVRQFVLQQKNVGTVLPAMLASQIAGLQKAKAKIPLYHQTKNIVYPLGLNLEQSSSQATALFKAQLIKENIGTTIASGADLTGGFGIDSFFMAQACKALVHVEPDKLLQEIAQHNHQQLNSGNIHYVNSTAEEFTGSASHFDFLYIDPSRRKETKKMAGLRDCVPDVVSLQSEIFKRAHHLLVKASPLLDISQALIELCNVRRVFAVAVENECKELLFWCEKEFEGTPTLTAVDLLNTGAQLSSFTFTQLQEASAVATYLKPQAFLYEPNTAILKAGAFKSIAQSFALNKLAPSTHLYTTDRLLLDFPGRIFKVEQEVKPDAKALLAVLPNGKANVSTRNYPLTPEELKKKLKLADGGEKYVLAFSGEKEKHLLLCDRIK
jgi:hypothetical protein